MEIKVNKLKINNLELDIDFEKNKIHGLYGDNNLFELIMNRNSSIKLAKKKDDKIGYMIKDLYKQFIFSSISKELFSITKKSKQKETLELVGLDESYLKRNPKTLSSSEARKLSLALFINNFDTILLDHPTTNFDYQSKRNFISLMRKLQKEGKTILILSDDIDLLYTLSDTITIFAKEKIVNGLKNEIFKNKELDKLVTLPSTVSFSNYALEHKKVRLGIRFDITDLIKDIYRHAS